MNFPEERVAEVCQLGPIKAAEVLDKALAGDPQALADFAVRSAYQKFLKMGASPAAALRHTRNLVSNIRLKVSFAS